MRLLAGFFTFLVALMHAGFLAMEMFFWETSFVQEAFDITPQFARETAFMAANQGLYNGFLVAGLLWGLVFKKKDVVIFFLLCVVIAGVYGAMTVKPSIFFIQAVPAMVALIFTFWAKPKGTIEFAKNVKNPL
jgi:putative membrane protein